MRLSKKHALLKNRIFHSIRSLPFFEKIHEAPHLLAGRRGEMQAEHFLKKAGLQMVARRIRIGYDEIDLVAREGDTLVFIEVKTRENENFGRAATSVDHAKRRNLSRAAIRFLKKRKLRPPYIRFDIVEVIGKRPVIRHIQNAFSLKSGFHIWW